jgi:hypothetical protein
LIDPNTNTAPLPKDFVNYVNIGFVDECTQQIVPFGRDDYLTPQITPAPNEFDCTCGCGCGNPVCNSIQKGVTTTTSNVIINGQTYQQVTRVCTDGNGNIIQETQTPTLIIPTPVQQCEYSITILNEGFLFSYTLVDYKLNGVIYDSGVIINNQSNQDNFFITLGFSKISNTTYRINNSTNVWSYIDIQGIAHVQVPFVQSGCFTPSPIQLITTTQTICKTGVKPCGCLDITPEVVNVLNSCNCCNWGTWNIWWWGYYSWWYIWNKWKQPLDKGFNQFGYYRVMPYEGYVIFSSNVNYLCCCASSNCAPPQSQQQAQNNACASVNFKNVVLEYYSNGNLEESNFYIPVIFFDPLVNYIAWQKINRKLNIPQAEKDRAERLFNFSKITAQRRKEPLRITELLAVLRTNVNP